ncbi:MAG: hypothetical protein PHV80_06720 [Rugosibacter sp.]|nr:hypothetical protein [Rugosibacter sp.]
MPKNFSSRRISPARSAGLGASLESPLGMPTFSLLNLVRPLAVGENQVVPLVEPETLRFPLPMPVHR